MDGRVRLEMARRVMANLAQPQLRASIGDELVYQTFIRRSDDMAEQRPAARTDLEALGGCRACPHEDMTADITGNLDRTQEATGAGLAVCQPALRVGRRRELGWAATWLASPYARFVSGRTLVVDGANWQRRSLTNPPVVTVRDQMGKGPYVAT